MCACVSPSLTFSALNVYAGVRLLFVSAPHRQIVWPANYRAVLNLSETWCVPTLKLARALRSGPAPPSARTTVVAADATRIAAGALARLQYILHRLFCFVRLGTTPPSMIEPPRANLWRPPMAFLFAQSNAFGTVERQRRRRAAVGARSCEAFVVATNWAAMAGGHRTGFTLATSAAAKATPATPPVCKRGEFSRGVSADATGHRRSLKGISDGRASRSLAAAVGRH